MSQTIREVVEKHFQPIINIQTLEARSNHPSPIQEAIIADLESLIATEVQS